jgi:hypothetical protein
MKITNTRVRQLIKEEIEKVVNEMDESGDAWDLLVRAVSGKKIEIGGSVKKSPPGLWIFPYNANGQRQSSILEKDTHELLKQALLKRGMNDVIEELRGSAKEVINKLHNKDGSRPDSTDGPTGRPPGPW